MASAASDGRRRRRDAGLGSFRISLLRRGTLPLIGLCAAGMFAACSDASSGDPVLGTAGVAGVGGVSAGGAAGTGSIPSGGAFGSSGASGSSGGAGAAAAGAGSAGSGGGGASSAALCPATALFCDDFEDDAPGQVPGSPWRTTTNGGSVAVDATRAFSGQRSVLASAPQGPTFRRAFLNLRRDSGIFPDAEREMYGRVMLWLEAAPTEVHWTLIQGQGPAANGTHDAMYRYGGQHGTGRLMANYETNNNVATDCYDHSQTLIPTGAWACAEWRFAVATNEMQFWLNGSEVSDIHITGRGEGCGGNGTSGQWLAPPAFDNLFLGWEHYQPWPGDVRIWLDAVAVSTERVGCPTPSSGP